MGGTDFEPGEVRVDRDESRDRDSKNRDRDRYEDSGKDRRKEERNRDKEKDKERNRDKEKEKDRESRNSSKLREKERERGKDRERDRDRDREKVRDKDRGKEKESEKDKEKDREKARERDKLKEKEKEKSRSKDKEREKDGERNRDREKDKSKDRERSLERDDKSKSRDKEARETGRDDTSKEKASELREKISKMKEERLKEKEKEEEQDSEILSWVSKSRKLYEKRNVEREKAIRLSQALEEQDKLLAGSDDDDDDEYKGHASTGDHLAGVKVLHGLDKVMEGGAVVLTLKDQNILAGDDVNEDVDMLENVEIGEQKRRNDMYQAAKKKTGIYDDKFSDDTGYKKPILPQYDDPVEDEGVTLDEGGRFTGEAEKKLEELRRRIEGSTLQKPSLDLTASMKTSSEYYTPEEMLQFKKPKKKKSLRKKEKLDLDALEAEAKASGLGASDLGSRNDPNRLAAKSEQEKAVAEARKNAYQAAIEKAEEAARVIREGQIQTVEKIEGDGGEELVFGDDYDDLQRSVEQARKLAMKKQEEKNDLDVLKAVVSATEKKIEGEVEKEAAEGGKLIITEMEEFVWGLQLKEETLKPETEDVFMDVDSEPETTKQDEENKVAGWSEVKESESTTEPPPEEKDEITPDEIIHEAAVGKGLAGALKLLKDRGTLNEGIDWGGRTMDKKKSKLVGIVDEPAPKEKEIRIERTDEFGRIMTPKEAFRALSHKFHGKGPGKMKQEKRMKKFHEDLKTKQMRDSDTPLQSMEKMREAQARMKTPYLVLSGNIKPGQTSDPSSGFATVEKDVGSLTPMLGDRKVEHFLGIKRNADAASMPPPPPKKPKN
ncbi:U4/U6.U5 tri-snRNP-associated protein 1 [Rhynchospora pubera]|uniref:U4/U6.U5 tri-snRNP-associated protein 1 n=1 Tax=Rhynchospora pubera TaxID=906938 RepID=A0AAV8DB70_9POAL|nr:U4/U6.U5 tri-snRNP-associated protein 1 [Rhynchospora pubera]